MDDLELYKLAFKKELVNKIKDLELPPEWRPYEVIRFVVGIIERG